ncbi:hypothetical protein MPTK1_5g07580 [Marchantia polymorpha subsp. ruderalis]|uniref:Myb-like domain-containing protein n=2 Tax=Marchantia polymorpha TaxID=3197 RepID=A0A176WRS7_MARPO|nr:hypothetical protein AXG93_1162s1010 [Marchantia polymorpha subsp. ruderalis]PTQ30242.1 hypothetical protein MARPO_0127s0027 [Marchantia polymorpha]BBN10922.1 hypothetical protein Mp_5g07580 [Marchantia polymorpha subsp. ruderalis]|eukprot:PTQ30242.1 hypothetical protein MARPO_0127s0027 [Marchantia polymorpha]
MAGSVGNNSTTNSSAAATSASPAVNGNHSSMYNSNAQGASTQSTTTTINSGNNGISRPNGPATNGSGNGTNSVASDQPPPLQLQLLHDPGITADWSSEEQATLDDGLTKFAGETSNLAKYIKIANLLPEKTVRDVAMRCRWMTKKEIGKRRKPEDQNASKKNKDKKDKSDSMSTKAPTGHIRPGLSSYTAPTPNVDNDDGISNDAIGGTTGQLLEQNSHVILQIRSNLAAMKLQENTELLVRFRDNICAILNGMTNMPGIMSQMPPLPVKLNTELADTILPKSLPQASPTSQT